MLSFLNDFPFLQLFVGFMIIFFWLFFLFISKNHLTPFFHTKKCIHSNITARNNFKYPCSVLFSSLYHFHHNFFHIFLRFFLSERKIKFIYVQRELIGKKIIRGYLFFLFRNRQPSKWYWQTNVKRQHEKSRTWFSIFLYKTFFQSAQHSIGSVKIGFSHAFSGISCEWEFSFFLLWKIGVKFVFCRDFCVRCFSLHWIEFLIVICEHKNRSTTLFLGFYFDRSLHNNII